MSDYRNHCLVFEKACKQEMQRLTDQYGFKFSSPPAHIDGKFCCTIFYNNSALICISDFVREGFSFSVRKFNPEGEEPMAHGEGKEYSIQKMLTHYINKYQATERFMSPYPTGSFEYYESSIRQYVDVLLKYGSKELKGDFSDLENS